MRPQVDIIKSEGVIGNNLFSGIIKGVFQEAKFDSKLELIFVRVIETDLYVLKWLRPNPQQFRIYYNRNRRYEPGFVVEIEDIIYLAKVKGEGKFNDPDVLAKKERAMKYCEISTEWGKINGYKEWKISIHSSGGGKYVLFIYELGSMV